MNIKQFRIALANAGFFTFQAAAEAIGMNKSTFSRRIKNESFSLSELKSMKKAYGIDDMDAVFFSN